MTRTYCSSVERICLRCGTHFMAKASAVRRGEGLFCSRACIHAGRVERRCLGCGAFFTVKPSKVTSGRGRYCSDPCAKKSRYAAAAVRFWQRVRQTAGCWHWTGNLHPNGYGAFTADGKTIKAHRFAYQLFYGDLLPTDHVLHLCDVRNCVSPGHLMKGGPFENMRQAVERGRMKTPWTAVLTPDTVRELRRLRDEGWSFPRLGKRFGIGKSTAANVVYRRAWKHVH